MHNLESQKSLKPKFSSDITKRGLQSFNDFDIRLIPDYKYWQAIQLMEKSNDGSCLFSIRDQRSRKKALLVFLNHNYNHYYQSYCLQIMLESYLHRLPVFSDQPAESIKFGVSQCGRFVYYVIRWQHDLPAYKLTAKAPYQFFRPALCAASYLKVLENCYKRFVPETGARSQSWFNVVDQRMCLCFRQISYKRIKSAAVEHFICFYEHNKQRLKRRRETLALNKFSPEDWYIQRGGLLTIPLITDWLIADGWYSLRSLFYRHQGLNENLRVMIIDAYFNFQPSEEFFICGAIYAMLDLLELLVARHNESGYKEPGYKEQLALIRQIYHDYDKFNQNIPRWYKTVSCSQKQQSSKFIK